MVNGNRFYVHPGTDLGPGLRGLAGTVMAVGQQRREDEKAQKALERYAKMKAGAMEAFRSGDPMKMAEFSLANPEMSQAMQQASGFFSKTTERNYQDSLFDFYQNPTPDNAADIVASRQDILRAQGVPQEQTQETDTFMDRFTVDPKGMKKQVEIELAWRYPQKYKSMKEAVAPAGGADPTTDMQNFSHYQTLLREDPKAAEQFATQVGITKPEKDARTEAIKNFEYAEKNPKFALQQQGEKDKQQTNAVSEKTYKNTTDLRKEFVKQSGEYIKVRDAYTRVIQSTTNPSPAGDLSLIFNYMKMLDPGSVVRESEFATAASAGSYGERMKAAVQKVTDGERLSPAMRADFLAKAAELFTGAEGQHTKRMGNYRDIAVKNNLPVDQVVIDITRPETDGTDVSELTDEELMRQLQE